MKLLYKKRNILYYTTFLILSLIIYSYIYFLLPVIQQKIEDRIIRYSSENIISVLNKIIDKDIREKRFFERILRDESYRETVKNQLQMFITDRLKYIFIIYKDEDNKYRYLLDASSYRDVAGFLFVPLEEEKTFLETVYKTGKTVYVTHKDVNTIGITYFNPIRQNGEIKAVLIIDFSFETLKEIESLVGSIKTGIIILALFTIFTLSVIFYYFIKNIFLRQRAYMDPLTKVYNRNYLEEINDTLDLSDYIVMVVDIDHFKNINDVYGYQIGDKVLRRFAEILKDNLRKEDLIIRYGGEEFLILLKKYRKDKKVSFKAAERLFNIVRKTKIEGIKLTISIGINIDTDKARNLTDAIKKADIALYKAKREGRNRIEIYTESTGKSDISLSELKEIIENKEIICFYQPIVNLKTGEVLYFEALARIKYKDKILPPLKYIEQIKGTFLYSKFTKNVIEYNAKILKQYKDIKISINLSPTDFLNESILQMLLELEDDLVKRMKLEVTETEDIQNYRKLKENIDKLSEKGFTIALDDFGKGYINFYYLTEIEAKYLKIDGSVIKNINTNEQYCKVVKNIVGYCKDTNKIPVAEFVENDEIHKKLLELGFEYGQGYYFAKPAPAEDIFKY
ncbi:EAL domain-containing protein [Persephonella sp.]